MLASLFCTLLYSTVLYCLLLCAELVVVHGSPLVLSSPVAAFLAAACLVACLIYNMYVLCGGVVFMVHGMWSWDHRRVEGHGAVLNHSPSPPSNSPGVFATSPKHKRWLADSEMP